MGVGWCGVVCRIGVSHLDAHIVGKFGWGKVSRGWFVWGDLCSETRARLRTFACMTCTYAVNLQPQSFLSLALKVSLYLYQNDDDDGTVRNPCFVSRVLISIRPSRVIIMPNHLRPFPTRQDYAPASPDTSTHRPLDEQSPLVDEKEPRSIYIPAISLPQIQYPYVHLFYLPDTLVHVPFASWFASLVVERKTADRVLKML